MLLFGDCCSEIFTSQILPRVVNDRMVVYLVGDVEVPCEDSRTAGLDVKAAVPIGGVIVLRVRITRRGAIKTIHFVGDQFDLLLRNHPSG